MNAASPYTLHAPGERPSWHGGANPAEDLAAFLAPGLNAVLMAAR